MTSTNTSFTSLLFRKFTPVFVTDELNQLERELHKISQDIQQIKKALIDKNNHNGFFDIDIEKLYDALDVAETDDQIIDITDDIDYYEQLFDLYSEENIIINKISQIKKNLDFYNKQKGICSKHNCFYGDPEDISYCYEPYCGKCDDEYECSSVTETYTSVSSYASIDSYG